MCRKRGAKEENIYIYDRGEKNRIRGYAIKLSSLSFSLPLCSERDEREGDGTRECSCDAGCVAVSDTPSAFIPYNLQCI